MSAGFAAAPPLPTRTRVVPGSEPATGTGSGYLSFVDGLRAVSILAVVGCHVGLPGFSGGYVGVDVFFVISGFLIINQIEDGLRTGRFSIVMFYARRGLRILPPFLVMYLAVALIAPFVLPTPDISYEFLLSALIAPAMFTNVLFWLRQGYFDISASEKPFLHTWTLSVEEQFYLVIPIVLVLLFRLRHRRFDRVTAAIAASAGLLSLAGAITQTPSEGPNAAFYLTHWRMWEFIAGGFIGAPLVEAAQRRPRLATEAMGLAGLVCIAVAVVSFDARTPYPSWRALLPVAGAVLTIVAATAGPRILTARLLALPGMVGIGLVSYAWYLWHWPILSFMRFSRLGQEWLLGDLLGGGLLGLALAYASYVVVERPIRRWKRSSGGIRHPGRIFAGCLASGVAATVIGASSALGGHLWITSFVASTYSPDGRGDPHSGCRVRPRSDIPSQCLAGQPAVLLGDSRAAAMFGSFARSFDDLGRTLTYVGRAGCDPLYLAPAERQTNRRHRCADLLAPFEKLLSAPTHIASVVVTPGWTAMNSAERWSGLLSQFDPSSTRILLLAPPPHFANASLDCVVLSDRYGVSRDRCTRQRSEVEGERAALVGMLENAADNGFGNIRYVDPMDLFCDAEVCRPFRGNQVFYHDGGHLSTQGADLVFDAFEKDFRWVAWKE